MKCMGRRKKEQTSYDNRWSYNVLYGTLAETGDVLYVGLGKATGTPATAARKYYRE